MKNIKNYIPSLKTRGRLFLFGLVSMCLYMSWAWHAVERIADPYIYELEDVPEGYETAMMLGTSTRLADGETRNAFHYHRVQAILDLFRNEKISKVLVSGDNGQADYNEPEDMKNDLMFYNVPEEWIELDFAGFRTFDSVVRTRSAFDLENVIIVSQRFHIQRALVIADAKGIDAIGYAAKDVALELAPRVYIREILARAWVFWDLYLFGTKAKFEQ